MFELSGSLLGHVRIFFSLHFCPGFFLLFVQVVMYSLRFNWQS